MPSKNRGPQCPTTIIGDLSTRGPHHAATIHGGRWRDGIKDRSCPRLGNPSSTTPVKFKLQAQGLVLKICTRTTTVLAVVSPPRRRRRVDQQRAFRRRPSGIRTWNRSGIRCQPSLCTPAGGHHLHCPFCRPGPSLDPKAHPDATSARAHTRSGPPGILLHRTLPILAQRI